MHGFKSFSDPVIIEFHEGITCIVGPNGSGKSNISDAIRWVLGEQSPKALRGGKMEEVIFAGTTNRKSRGMAEVVLVIDNSTHILDIDYSEVAITRRMYRSGESEYLINDNPCRLRDIRELIMDTGIGVDGYSIIGQGKIADIVSTKPESRREIFEEAAGVVMYKTKRQEAERKLESTSNNLERVTDIISEIESRIGGLREDSARAKEYLTLRESYKSLEINIILHDVEAADEATAAFRNDMAELKGKIDETELQVSGAAAENDALQARRGDIDRLVSELRSSVLETVNRINEITNRDQVSREKLAGIENEQEILARDSEKLHARLKEDRSSLAALEEELKSIDGETKKAEEVLGEAISAYNQAASVQAQASAKADEARSALFDFHNRKSSAESDAAGTDALADSLRTRRSELLVMSDASGRALTDAGDKVKKIVEDIKCARERLEAVERDIAELSAAGGEAGDELDSLRKTAADRSLEISRLSSRRRTIQELESNYDGYNFGVRSLMKAGLSGILGVAAELMEVPKGYETAIETALGASIQNIICETDEDAKRGVEFLKKNRSGRLTFLPVKTLRASRHPMPSALSGDIGFIGMAADIVSFEPQYGNVYTYLLGRVAVVKDMDSAIRLSQRVNGLRFVTPEGEIVNASGAITGGAYKNRSANILERKAEISELAETIENMTRQNAEASAAAEKLKVKIKKTAETLSSKQREKSGLDIDISSLESTLSAAKSDLGRETEAKDRIVRELSDIGVRLAESEELKSGAKAKIAEAEMMITETESLIEDALKASEEAKEETGLRSEEVTKARIALNDIRTRLESKDALVRRIREEIYGYEMQIREKDDRIDDLELEREAITDSTAGSDSLDELELSKSELEVRLDEAEKERDEIAEKQKTFEAERKERAGELNALRDSHYKLEIRLAKGESQSETLKQKLWDEFEISYAQAEDLKDAGIVYSRAVKEARDIRSRMRDLGDVNIGAIAEYEQVAERYEFLTAQHDDIVKARDELLAIIEDMDNTIKARFKENFDEVVKNFESIFTELFGGGQAELRLDDETDPLNSGIEIVAQPPGKKLQNINLMSGGEKTMTAIALMFAVLRTKPTPFCILDEVEAALDDTNIHRFAEYLKKFGNIQFALVTHQKATMEHADVLYGVTMPERGISKLLSLRLGDDFEL